jgi:hypothetical protein
MKLLRWLVLLPCAILGGWLAYLVMVGIQRASAYFAFQSPDSLVNSWFIESVGTGAAGAAFVWFGMKVAPVKLPQVAYGLAVSAVFIAGALALPIAVQRDWRAMWFLLCGLVGVASIIPSQTRPRR